MASAVNFDSLWGVWHDTTQADTNRLKAMKNIAIGFSHLNPDSAFYFAGLVYELAQSIGNKKGMAAALNIQGAVLYIQGNYELALSNYRNSLNIKIEIDDKTGIAAVYNNIGGVYMIQGNAEKAIIYHQKSLKINKELDDINGIAKSYNNIGLIYNHLGDYNQAMKFYKKSLKINERGNNKYNISMTHMNIGNIYYEQGNHKMALECFKKSLNVQKEIGNKIAMAYSYNNIGVVYNNQGNTKQAIVYNQKSIKINKETGDQSGLASSYNNLGSIYSKLHNIKQALFYYHKSRNIYKNLGNKYGVSVNYNNISLIYIDQVNYEKAMYYNKKSLIIAEELDNKELLAETYKTLGAIYFEQQSYNLALNVLQHALTLSQEIGIVKQTKEISFVLYELYKKTALPAKALSMHELYIEMRDSLNSIKNKEAAIKLEYQHQYEKEQALADAKHQEQITLSAEREKRQQLIANSAGGGLVMVLLFAFFIFNRLQVTRRQKKVIEQQKELVEEQKKDITDSIQYAENIQRALLPAEEDLSVFPEGFILFQPKDIVSGDFYWMQHNKDSVYLAACDCTGHGVPGAFMSMIGSSQLDEAVIEKGLTQPNEIFYEVRKGFINALKQTGEKGQQKDGMDATLIAWDKNNKLQFAVANNPLFLIRKGELLETKPDRQPVGFFTGEQMPFTHHELKLEKRDTVYIFSDGYHDQFGGPKNKKFMIKNFKKLLLSIQDKSMNEQKTIIEETMAQWKGDTEQVDDILVIGVRF